MMLSGGYSISPQAQAHLLLEVAVERPGTKVPNLSTDLEEARNNGRVVGVSEILLLRRGLYQERAA